MRFSATLCSGSVSRLLCHEHKSPRSESSRAFAFVLLCGCCLGLTACSGNDPDPNSEIGANPKLPEQSQYLLPPMHVASIIVWKEGETPVVPKDLQIKALATGLKHPRSV